MNRRKLADPYDGASEAVKKTLRYEGAVMALECITGIKAPWWMPARAWKRIARGRILDLCGDLFFGTCASDQEPER